VASFLEEGAGDAEGLEKALWADLACKAAVKDNNRLDEAAAIRLIREAFALEVPRCPHGRPIWFEISRRELFELVGRTV
jgi:DNA mismatch repair protein MutL